MLMLMMMRMLLCHHPSVGSPLCCPSSFVGGSRRPQRQVLPRARRRLGRRLRHTLEVVRVPPYGARGRTGPGLGLGPGPNARRICTHIPAGRWSSASVGTCRMNALGSDDPPQRPRPWTWTWTDQATNAGPRRIDKGNAALAQTPEAARRRAHERVRRRSRRRRRRAGRVVVEADAALGPLGEGQAPPRQPILAAGWAAVAIVFIAAAGSAGGISRAGPSRSRGGRSNIALARRCCHRRKCRRHSFMCQLALVDNDDRYRRPTGGRCRLRRLRRLRRFLLCRLRLRLLPFVRCGSHARGLFF